MFGKKTTATTHIDPVCGMKVKPATAAATRTRSETTIYFCSTHCAEAFDADPARYGHPQIDGEHHHEPTPAPHHH